MKKFTKIMLMTAAALAVLGIAFFAIAAAMGAGWSELREWARSGKLDAYGWHFGDGIYYNGSENGGNESASASVLAEGITVISVDLDAADVTIRLSDSAKDIEVEMENGYERYFEVESVMTTLSVTYDTDGVLYKNSPRIVVTVPEGIGLDFMEVDTSMGDVTISGDWAVENLDVTADMGDLSVEDGSYGAVTLDASMGDVSFDGEVRETLDISCGMGDVTVALPGAEDDYNYSLSCGIGEIAVNGGTAAGFLDGENGLSLTHENAAADIAVDCGMGDVTVKTAR